MLIAIVLLVLMAFAFFYIFLGYAVILIIGAPTLGVGRLDTQLAPSHLDFPSADRVDSQFVPFQYQFPSGDT